MPFSNFTLAASTAIILLLVEVVGATYSTVAVDHDTRQVGASGATCKGAGRTAAFIFGSVPGRGAACVQGNADNDNPPVFNRIRQLLSEGRDGRPPKEILEDLLGNDPDGEDPAERQYGIVSLKKGKKFEPAGQRGEDNPDFRGHFTGKVAKGFSYSIQGNRLTGNEVLTNLKHGFELKGRGGEHKGRGKKGRCDDLAERLYRSVRETLKDDTSGDAACTPDSPADTVFVHIDNQDGPPNPTTAAEGGSQSAYLDIRFKQSSDPLGDLDGAFEAWRANNKCIRRGPGPIKIAIGFAIGIAAITAVGAFTRRKLIAVKTVGEDSTATALFCDQPQHGGTTIELHSATAYVNIKSIQA